LCRCYCGRSGKCNHTQGINSLQGKAISAWNFVTDTAIGAIGGKVAGEVVPYVFKNFVPNNIKGQIGEGLSWIGLTATGRSFETQVANGVVRRGQPSTYDFGLLDSGPRSFVESKFGTAGLSSAQREAARIPGTDLTLHQWDYSTISGIVGSSFSAAAGGISFGGAAGGGFLLYPNKPNMNMSQGVYSK
jgi:hypothetical protein